MNCSLDVGSYWNIVESCCADVVPQDLFALASILRWVYFPVGASSNHVAQMYFHKLYSAHHKDASNSSLEEVFSSPHFSDNDFFIPAIQLHQELVIYPTMTIESLTPYPQIYVK